MAKNKDNKDKEFKDKESERQDNADNNSNLQTNINIDHSDAVGEQMSSEDEKSPPKPNGNEDGKENENEQNENINTEIVRIKAKSNTGFKNYYRCDLRFTPEFADFEVSPEILDSLKNDCHLTIVEDKKD